MLRPGMGSRGSRIRDEGVYRVSTRIRHIITDVVNATHNEYIQYSRIPFLRPFSPLQGLHRRRTVRPYITTLIRAFNEYRPKFIEMMRSCRAEHRINDGNGGKMDAWFYGLQHGHGISSKGMAYSIQPAGSEVDFSTIVGPSVEEMVYSLSVSFATD